MRRPHLSVLTVTTRNDAQAHANSRVRDGYEAVLAQRR
jgi:hypothetical protein